MVEVLANIKGPHKRCALFMLAVSFKKKEIFMKNEERGIKGLMNEIADEMYFQRKRDPKGTSFDSNDPRFRETTRLIFEAVAKKEKTL